MTGLPGPALFFILHKHLIEKPHILHHLASFLHLDIWDFFFFWSWLIRKDSSKKLSISSRVQLYLKLNVFSRCDGERSSAPRLYKIPRLCRSSCKWSNTSEIATAWRHTQCLPSQFLSSSMGPLYEILPGNLRLILSSLSSRRQLSVALSHQNRRFFSSF